MQSDRDGTLSNKIWKTRVTCIRSDEIIIRGYRIEDLIGRIPFSQVAYLVMTGELPSPEEGELIDALLASCVDHGVTPPSAISTRIASSTGASLSASVAAGVLSLNRSHGGSAQEAMHFLLEGERWRAGSDLSFPEMGERLARGEVDAGRRVPGFGHRLHQNDPRVPRLIALAREASVAKNHVLLALAIEESLQKTRERPIPLNIDGIIAAILCDLDVDVELANAFFMFARIPGLIAHAVEERLRFSPMRDIDPKHHEYDGKEDKTVPER